MVVCLFDGAIYASSLDALCTATVAAAQDWNTGAVENWEIQRVVAVSPTNANDCDAAYLLKVAYGEEQAEVVVEFAAPSAVASGGYAQEVVGKFLRFNATQR